FGACLTESGPDRVWKAAGHSVTTGRSFGTDGLSAPFLRGNVGQRLGERPLMARRILGLVLPFAVVEVGRLHEDACPVRSRPFAVGPCVVHPHHHRVRDLAGMGWTTVPPHIGNDQGTVTEPELSAVILADAHPLDKPEGRRKP